MAEKKAPHLHGGRSGAALAVHVIPRARKNEIAGVSAEGTVKVHLISSQPGGEANLALIELLAEVLGSPKNRIEIVAGHSGKDKLVSILDLDADKVNQRILAAL
jgi:uncharacterized protein YggU (UPF0235/DUF167 family)